jgi:hypothetical protein
MFTVNSLGLAVIFCVITMLGWGSWANTQKLAGKTKWPFELYYWDYAIGVFLFSLVFMFTLGSTGGAGMGALENLRLAGTNLERIPRGASGHRSVYLSDVRRLCSRADTDWYGNTVTVGQRPRCESFHSHGCGDFQMLRDQA